MGRVSESKWLQSEIFWGRSIKLDVPMRITALVFTIAALASMSFAQLSFWSMGVIDGNPVYLFLTLGVLFMGAFLFGPLTGALLGLYAGAVAFAHATLLPLDYYEIYFMTPSNTFAMLTVLGALAGWLFSVALRDKPKGAARIFRIVLICVVLSFVASGIMEVSALVSYYGFKGFSSVGEALAGDAIGITLQAAIDAAFAVLVCCGADFVVRKSARRAVDRRLLTVFRGWMIVISFIVFMVTSGIIFSVVTLQAEHDAEEDMRSEVSYLSKQLNNRGSASYNAILDGYEVDVDGSVAILDGEGTVLATDDEEGFPPGCSFFEKLGFGNMENVSDTLASLVEEKSLYSLEATGGSGFTAMSRLVLAVERFDDGYVAMLRSSNMIYGQRLGVMTSSTILAIALIVSIALVASLLLNRVVVRRIDETNGSLDEITGGDLSVRVHGGDSREFASLAAGINTTVSALKESIADAEQRNAQELATAKAIQESSLPTEFPAFPDINRFDIYASMKTAREVGGDFYDFFEIEGASKIGFVMADVSGKGIPAALFMMTAKTQIRTYMENGLPIGEAVNAANHQLCLSNDAGMFVTMLAFVIDYETGALDYVNAGHNPPLLLHDGQWSWMRDVSGMPLGLFDGIPYERLSRQLDVGDMLYLYTDGVTEAMNTDEEMFGEDRLENTLYKYAQFNPRSVCVGVRRAITDFTLDCEQSDDITMLAMKYGVPPETRAVMVLQATDDQLIHVCNYIHAELHRRRAPKSVQNPLDIAAEELFINVCRYAYPDATPDDPGEVRISFEYEANPPSLTVQIADDGVPYNPLAKPDAVTPDDIAAVPIGGLGILMAKKSVDEMTYERVGDSNVVTFVKKW